MQNGISKEPLSKVTFSKIVKSVLNLSGFFKGATVHAIRRYLGKQIDGKSPKGLKGIKPGFLTSK